MHKCFKKTLLVSLISVVLLFSADVAAYRIPVRGGNSGSEVMMLQQQLKTLGYFKYPEITGYFGPVTRSAVIEFQKKNCLAVDGIAGAETYNSLTVHLKYAWNSSTHNSGGNKILPASRTRENAGIVPWAVVDAVFERGTRAMVYDLYTGRSFTVYRLGGDLHADVEPLTKRDTEIMKKICGGNWSWDRRPVLVEIDGVRVAASMNGMPHGVQNIYGNNFDGHFCIHFWESRVHISGKMDEQHQTMVMKAASAGR